jgi:hypothetical protein
VLREDADVSAEIEDSFVGKSIMTDLDRCELAGGVIRRENKRGHEEDRRKNSTSHDGASLFLISDFRDRALLI